MKKRMLTILLASMVMFVSLPVTGKAEEIATEQISEAGQTGETQQEDGIRETDGAALAEDTVIPVVSVLGDSISTWDTVSKYPVYMGYYGEKYPGLSNQNETYWQMYINYIHGKLGRLGLVGGSKVVDDGTMGDLYMASDKRINDLKNEEQRKDKG